MPKADEAPRLHYLDEPKPGTLTITYQPNGSAIQENPPRFSWLPALDDNARYALKVSRNPSFPPADTLLFEDLNWNFFTPDVTFEPGVYHWAFALWDGASKTVVSAWSSVRIFEILPGLPETPLPRAQVRWNAADLRHPRLWLGPSEVGDFRERLEADADHCGWQGFFDKSVAPWLTRDFIAEPALYPNNVRVAKLWRQMYIDCQEAIYAVRHLAIAGVILDDPALITRAREWLLAIARWDRTGATARSYNDEAAFRVVTALAWGYDWLWDHLDDTERTEVRDVLLARTREVADHVLWRARIHVFPYDSHAVRSLSAALTAACIALAGESDEAESWLDYTIEFLFTLYSPWGDADGGWAEGPHYWMTGIAYLTEAANLIKNFLDVDLYKRPFFHKTGDFPLYTKAPGTRRACFGDDSTLGDPPGVKVGYNVRQFAGVTGNPYYQWYYERLKADAAGTEMEFYNYGWWDLNFDDLVYRHDYPQITAQAPSDLPPVKWFKDIGWVAIQKYMDDPARHIQFLFKSSTFGSLSHSHGDQNAFLLYAFGEDLAIQSGYYVAFNSTMHRNWRRQTISKNAILIDGKGQYADGDKTIAKKAGGRIVTVREEPSHVFISGDATAAYRAADPDVLRAERDVYFTASDFVVLVDRVECSRPKPVQWLFHATRPMDVGTNSFRLTGERAGLYGQFVHSTSGPPNVRLVEGFEGIDPADVEGMDTQYHIEASLPSASKHTLVTLLVPYSLDEPRRVFNFIDDQGFSADIYFTDVDDNQLRIVIPKNF
ncbi:MULTISPECIES: DUF4962 domain-containing protein [unclassified Ensifer]|uniref:DUF4962 domain-containing protein n=1 Tax=unclassified Ensifer TaxID=2633371 RepID=UPI00070EA3C3|nr:MULTISPECIES: DUF4962 domain-containing protein [unclassified Ensifer]KQW50149.1 alginate lyase [Ensifer sp. Root1252]KRC74373.1 alginate lyase [Ensifer sp. Root231]KRD03086.1 alginate lyase [Ensifer sp. Root258]